MARALADTVYRRLHAFPFAGGELTASAVMADPFVVVEAQHDANIYLRRCGLQPVDVTRLLEQSAATSDDDDENDDDDRDHDDDDDPPQMVAMLSVDMMAQHIAAQDYSQASDAVKAQVTFVIQQLSLYKLVLQMKPHIFDSRPDHDVLNNIAAFDQGRRGLLLCSGLSLSNMRTSGGERVRRVLRRTCAESCLQLGDAAAISCLMKGDMAGAVAAVDDMMEFANVLVEETAGWCGQAPSPADYRVEVALAQLQLLRLKHNRQALEPERSARSDQRASEAKKLLRIQWKEVRALAAGAAASTARVAANDDNADNATNTASAAPVASTAAAAACGGGSEKDDVAPSSLTPHGVGKPDTGGDARCAKQHHAIALASGGHYLLQVVPPTLFGGSTMHAAP